MHFEQAAIIFLSMSHGTNEDRIYQLSIATPVGALPHICIAVPDYEMRLVELAPFFRNLTNEYVGLHIRARESQGKSLSCGPNCGACCKQLVPLSAIDVFALVEHLLARPIHTRKPLLDAFAAIESRLGQSGIEGAIRGVDDVATITDAARAYFFLDMDCPFLLNGSCSIHEIRPLACREYNVVSPPGLCSDPFNRPIQPIGLHRRISVLAAHFTAQIADVPDGLVPFPVMFDWYDTYRGISLQKFPAQALFDELFSYLSEELK
ncbi:MAG: hypothetical protein GF398_15960 [Chitinivibrionales bacterium]|nr:hypothetical protein [Chitinivibrionales bacterium]